MLYIPILKIIGAIFISIKFNVVYNTYHKHTFEMNRQSVDSWKIFINSKISEWNLLIFCVTLFVWLLEMCGWPEIIEQPVTRSGSGQANLKK